MTILFERRQINGWSYYCVPELERRGILHGFFTRESPDLTIETDRKLFLDVFSVTDAIMMNQVHGDQVHVIEDAEHPVTGDGLLLVKKGVAGIIKTADCMPVIIADPDCPIAAIVHAGWRGTVFRITQKAVRAMITLGAERERIIALLGPSIRSCCYNVGEDVRNAFRREKFVDAVFREVDGGLFLDLVEANRRMLENEGVTEIRDSGHCTFHDGSFASYRRGELSSRQVSFVSLMDGV